VVFAIASIGLVFALAFKSKEYPTNFALLAAFVSIVKFHIFTTYFHRSMYPGL